MVGAAVAAGFGVEGAGLGLATGTEVAFGSPRSFTRGALGAGFGAGFADASAGAAVSAEVGAPVFADTGVAEAGVDPAVELTGVVAEEAGADPGAGKSVSLGVAAVVEGEVVPDAGAEFTGPEGAGGAVAESGASEDCAAGGLPVLPFNHARP